MTPRRCASYFTALFEIDIEFMQKAKAKAAPKKSAPKTAKIPVRPAARKPAEKASAARPVIPPPAPATVPAAKIKPAKPGVSGVPPAKPALDMQSNVALGSIKSQSGVDLTEKVKELLRLLPEGEPLYGPDVLTDRTERFLATDRKMREASP